MAKKKLASAAAAEEVPQLSFEQSLASLEEIVARLEGGKLPLAESLAAYQQGVSRLKLCYELLEHAELKINQVSQVDDQGRPRLEPYHDGAEGDDAELSDAKLSEKADARSRRRTAPVATQRQPTRDDISLF